MGAIGGDLSLPTWVDFSSVEMVDNAEFMKGVSSKIKSVTALKLPQNVFCEVLRCALRSDDVPVKYSRLIGDTASMIGCP
ncbi:hypothetical protein D9M68_981680 [compost metagenome]